MKRGNGTCWSGRSGYDGAADLDDHRLDEVHHRLLGDEAHLDVELGELGLPVAAQVLVAEAARDLEVAVHARDHEDLLELLRALRQRIHVARLEPRRDDEVARALRGRLDEDRRLDLDEAGPVVRLADRLDEPRTQDQPLLERLAADVEVAVLEPQRLLDGGVRLVDVERRRLRLRQDLEAAGAKLDGAGRQAGILGPGEACRDWSRGGDDELVADAARRLVGLRSLGPVDHDLGDAVAVAQVEEDELAVVPPAMDPARQLRVAADVVARRAPHVSVR